MRFLSGMGSHVNIQRFQPGEGLCALGAGVRSRTTVCFLVTSHATRLGESLVTLCTRIRFFSRVDSIVLCKAF